MPPDFDRFLEILNSTIFPFFFEAFDKILPLLNLPVDFFLLLLLALDDFFLQQAAVLVSLGLQLALHAFVLPVLLTQLLVPLPLETLNLLLCEHLFNSDTLLPIDCIFRAIFFGNFME